MNNESIAAQLNALIPEIHQIAVEHGWWEGERDYGDIIALIHSELSEALEEYRRGKPNFYFVRNDDWNGRLAAWKGEKPEGILVELADCIIRILDYFGKEGYQIQEWIPARYEFRTFGRFLEDVSIPITTAFVDEKIHFRFIDLVDAMELILWYFEYRGVEPFDLIKAKVQYNRTRPYKHGNKVI